MAFKALDKLQINNTDVLTFDGTNIILSNVLVDDGVEISINSDNLTEGTTNRFFTPARETVLTNADIALDGRLDTLEGAGTGSVAKALVDAKAYADQAELDAIATANTYTDTAELDAIASANTYTDTAELDAISTAASDATTKADQALVDAKAYADTAVSGVANHSTTDTLTEGSTNLYYTNARADARAQAKIDALVGAAPAALDTLNELATALGDDANFSTTVTNQIAAITHDGLTGFVANEHIDWTAASAGTIDPSNYVNTNTNTTYTGGTGITLTGTVFSNDITNNNQLTNGAGYITSATDTTYTAGTNVSISAGNVISATDTDTNTTYTAGNGLTLTGTSFTMSGAYTGDFTATGDVTAYSDRRLKRNIETINNPLEIVNALRGVNFEKDGRHSTGVIAQEVEEVFPAVVHTDADGMKSVAYGNITGLLLEAIKEQQVLINSLQDQINNIK